MGWPGNIEPYSVSNQLPTMTTMSGGVTRLVIDRLATLFAHLFPPRFQAGASALPKN